MPIVADAAAAVRADMTPFQRDFARGMNKAESQVGPLGKTLSAALNPKSLLLGLGGGLAGSQVISFLVDAGQAASDLNETVSATGQIFGEDVTPQLEAWAETAADSFGQSQRQALDAANTFATFGKSAGLAGDDLVGFSTDLTELASDLASFRNTSPEEAIQAIGAALRGESEPIRRYGVLLDEATLKQRALRLGIIDTTSQALTPQQRVLAAQAEIFEQTADAQGDFARTADGLANTQRTLNAQWEDAQAELGEAILPLLLELAHIVTENVIPAITDLTALFGGKGVEDGFFTEAATNLAKLMDSFGDSENDVEGFVDEVERISSKLGVSYLEARDLVKQANEEMGMSVDEFADRIDKGLDPATAKVVTLGVTFGRVPGDVGKALEAGEGDVREGADAAFGPIDEAAQEAHDAAVDEIADMFEDLTDLFTKDDFKDAVEEFHETINNPWSDTKRRARIEAELASKEVREGLRSEDSRVRAETIEFVNRLVEEYETLAPGALAAGELVNPNLQDGLKRNLQQTLQVAEGIAIATGNQLDFREWAEQAGVAGLLGFQRGMNAQRSNTAVTAQRLAGVARANMHFDAYAGGVSSAQTFINGLAGTLTSWDAVTRLQNALQLLKTRTLGGSLPISGPFAKRPLAEGAISIGQFWSDVLADTVNRRMGLSGIAPGVPSAPPPGSVPAVTPWQTAAPTEVTNVYFEGKLPVETVEDVAYGLRDGMLRPAKKRERR